MALYFYLEEGDIIAEDKETVLYKANNEVFRIKKSLDRLRQDKIMAAEYAGVLNDPAFEHVAWYEYKT